MNDDHILLSPLPETEEDTCCQTLLSEPEEISVPVLTEQPPAQKKTLLSNKKYRIPLIAAAVVLAVLCLWLFSAVLDPYDNRILSGVSVGGLDVGGMTRSEARKALKKASESTLEHTVLTVVLPEETLDLSPADTNASLKAVAAARAAFKVGRFGSREEKLAALTASQSGQTREIGLAPYLNVNENYIRGVLADYAAHYDTNLTAGSWWTEGAMPDLSTKQTADQVAQQTLQIKLGIPTARLDQEDAWQKILSVYDRAFSACADNDYTVRDFRVDILEPAVHPDPQEIYDTLFLAPVDDSLDMTTYQMVFGSYGYGFDPDLAGKQLAAAECGETISIPMEITAPEILGDGVYFRDVLGYCETPHTKDENRNHNLRMACDAMDGMILQPGDVFSYNDTLGPRTKENGYKRAGAYSGWELVMSYGGGICQGSSTIYGAVLHSDLEIVERRNHGIAVSYVKLGLDATVNWGGPDFRFRNSTNFPIKITAEVSDGLVKVAILGTEERDYYVEMESEVGYGSDAIYCKSYKCKYDKETGELISREMEARSNYMR